MSVRRIFVRFNYRGWHQELFRQIALGDLAFAAGLLEQLSDQQWRDAFRAGGFSAPVGDRFVARLKQKLDEARRAADTPGVWTVPTGS